jgi:CHASE1-domain containing sensor protein
MSALHLLAVLILGGVALLILSLSVLALFAVHSQNGMDRWVDRWNGAVQARLDEEKESEGASE